MAPDRSRLRMTQGLNNDENNSNFILNIYSPCLYWYSDHLHLYIYIFIYLYICMYIFIYIYIYIISSIKLVESDGPPAEVDGRLRCLSQAHLICQ